jgi:ADP-heptose:LPS heptosyltransferase
LLTKVGLTYQAPNASIYPDPIETGTVNAVLGNRKKWVAIHISARKISQRWPAEQFAGLIQQLATTDPELGFLLLWAPGDEGDPKHPGDNAKAQAIISASKGLPVVPFPTYTLESLIAALSLADSVICCDGGAMHVAAGLGKPIACLFGDSDPARWRPWGVSYQLLQAKTRRVNDIDIAAVLGAWRLLSRAALDP